MEIVEKEEWIFKINKLYFFLAMAVLLFTALSKPMISYSASNDSTGRTSSYIVQVNGVKLTQDKFDAEISQRIAMIKNQIPPGRLQQMEAELKKQIVDDFLIRTLLSQEVKKRRIAITEEEVSESLDRMKAGLPPGGNIDDLLKKNNMTADQFREEITLGVKINKLLMSLPTVREKPTEKDIAAYYNDNKDKFSIPEMVHVRHILIAKSGDDDEKTTKGKKAKAENLRNKLLQGVDFAEMAVKNSDDGSSKEKGGDLGVFSRGQMVKAFEDAAFSQKVDAVGKVVETEFGYHIIQVLERQNAEVVDLDKKLKDEISAFLAQQRRQDAFMEMVKKLRAKATILVPGK